MLVPLVPLTALKHLVWHMPSIFLFVCAGVLLHFAHSLCEPLLIKALCPPLARTPEASSEDTAVMSTGTTTEDVAGRV